MSLYKLHSVDVLTLFTKNQKQVFIISDKRFEFIQSACHSIINDEFVCWFYGFIKRRVSLFLLFGYLESK